MCFSAEANLAKPAILLRVGALSVRRAVRLSADGVPIVAEQLLFGLQQRTEPSVAW